jgi:hypothetical protein
MARPSLAALARSDSGGEPKATRGCPGCFIVSRTLDDAKTSEVGPRAKTREGAKKPIRSLASLRHIR